MNTSSFRFKRPLIALAVASVMAAGCTDFKVPGVSEANAVTAPPAATQAAQARQLPDFASLVEQQGPAVVKIAVTKAQSRAALPGQAVPPEMEEFFRHFGIPRPEGQAIPRPAPTQGVGSGFIISPDGYILTNAHVVDGASEVTVKLSDKRELTAKVIGVDPMTDVAVVKVDAKGLPVVKIGDPSKTRVGEWVAAIGSPFGMEHSVTSGIVSAKSRSLPSEQLVPFIQTDVAVNPGNSGGPLFNMAGEVIGVNSQIYSTTGGYMGMSFAIPIDVAMKVKDELVEHGKVTRGRIGVAVQEVTPQLAGSFGLEKARGALVANVDTGGPAAKGGLKAGDIIVGFDGKPIESSGELPALVAGTKPGATVTMRVMRDGAEKDVKVTVGEMPSRGTTLAAAQGEAQGKLGVAVQEVTPQLAGSFGLEKARGALVANVDSGGPAAKGGLKAGDIIVGFDGKPIESSGELPALVAGTKPGTSVSMRVMRDGAEKDVKVTVAEMPSRGATLAAAQGEAQGKLGVSVRPGDNGVVVERADGPAAKAGIRAGDIIVGVNGKPVKSVDELKSAIDAAGKQVALLVQRGEARIFVPVQIG